MSWNLATSTHLINGFLLSWTHLEMGNCKTFLIKIFWWETHWTPLPKMIHQNLSLQFHKGSYRKGWNILYYSAAIWHDGLKCQLCFAPQAPSCKLCQVRNWAINIVPNWLVIRSFVVSSHKIWGEKNTTWLCQLFQPSKPATHVLFLLRQHSFPILTFYTFLYSYVPVARWTTVGGHSRGVRCYFTNHLKNTIVGGR